jgi:hypothetical protein
MLLEALSENGKPLGKCFAKKCDDCNFYKLNRTVRVPSLEEKVRRVCQWQLFFNQFPDLVGSIDGVQAASNEARNRSVESKEATIALGQATLKSFEMLGEQIEQKEFIQIGEVE